jgi:chromosome segregation ATPase
MASRKITFLFGGLVFLSIPLFAQSLGDVARQQRQKQNDKPAGSHKVITDEDMPTHPADADTDKVSDKAASEHPDAPINTETNSEELKARCVEIKQAIKDYQAQLDQLRASTKFVEANRYVNGVQYNQHQLAKQQEADRMEKRLEQMKAKLADLQERARKAGFGSSVYDP